MAAYHSFASRAAGAAEDLEYTQSVSPFHVTRVLAFALEAAQNEPEELVKIADASVQSAFVVIEQMVSFYSGKLP